jgi:hypothetical protein
MAAPGSGTAGAGIGDPIALKDASPTKKAFTTPTVTRALLLAAENDTTRSDSA